MRTVAIIQARMGGTRLPGKVLAEACGKPLLQHMIERLERCETLDEILVATPKTRENQPIAQLIADMMLDRGWETVLGWTSGDELDVLGRVLEAARTAKADLIVELTADCPLIDPEIVDSCVREFFRWKDENGLLLDFVTNTREAVGEIYAYPRGMDVRVFPTEVLERVNLLTKDPSDREHVSLYIWEHPNQFDIQYIAAPEELRDDVRLTVDEPADLELVRKVFESFVPSNDFSLADILSLLASYPEWRDINAHIEQKAVR